LLMIATFDAGAFAVVLLCAAVARADYTVSSCGANDNENVFTDSLPPGGSVNADGSSCPAGAAGGLLLSSSQSVNGSDGSRGAWQANAPAGLEIVAASVAVPGITAGNINNSNSPWGGGVYWAGGGQEIPTELDGGGSWYGFDSPYFGFQLVCGATPCSITHLASLKIDGTINFSVRETVGPSLSAPDGLWQATGWVRGQWPLNFSGSSPSGMCALNGTFNQIPLNGTSSPRDVATWQQCAAPAVSDTINTASYGEGPMPLYIAGYDAAGETVSDTETINVDNSTPTLSLSGATDAPSTAGMQYVTATSGGSPSGIDGIDCSVDHGPEHWYSGASAQVPVSGLGEHSVSCNAFNNAVDEKGVHGVSATQTWSLKIGAPTVMGVGFAKYVGLKCHVVKQRKTIQGHWVTRTRHGKKIKVKTRTRHKIVEVTKCHPRTVRKRVVVRVPLRHHGKIVRRHGRIVYRKKIEHRRVAVTPHWKSKAKEHVRFGRSTTVNGWLGLSDGTALGGQTVDVLTAPDNGLGQFSVAAAATTAANGTWTAALPPGPSRIVEASYAGSPDTEATGSGQVTIVVHSKIKLKSVTPSRVAWGHSVTITGKLEGGYLPAGGVNVRLRIGIGGAKATYGVQERVAGNGRFTTTYTFGAGDARIHRSYWFQIATLPSGNYPYAPSSSNRIYVKVGGHPSRAGRHRHRH
ncbi:MAG: hypothetical protein WAL22_14440, partial [Solirubrobacteraceae bacterium]